MKKRPLPPGAVLHSEKGKRVFKGVRFDVYQWEQKQFDGTTATYEVIKREDSVIIIPVIDDEIMIVNEMQPHWTEYKRVLIAGGIHHDEDLETSARRELEEETGMVFKDFYLVSVDMPTPGVEWCLYVFIAKNLVETKEKKLDPGEKNEVERISFEKLMEMTKGDQFFYRPRFIQEFIVKDKVDELKDVLKNPEKYAIAL